MTTLKQIQRKYLPLILCSAIATSCTKKGHTDMEAKAKRRETQWPIDTKAAFDAGVRFVKKADALKEN